MKPRRSKLSEQQLHSAAVKDLLVLLGTVTPDERFQADLETTSQRSGEAYLPKL